MIDDPGSLRERIARLETSHEHMSEQIDTMATQITEMHDVLLQAKGARWTVIAAAMIVGFVVANFPGVAKVLGFLR